MLVLVSGIDGLHVVPGPSVCEATGHCAQVSCSSGDNVATRAANDPSAFTITEKVPTWARAFLGDCFKRGVSNVKALVGALKQEKPSP